MKHVSVDGPRRNDSKAGRIESRKKIIKKCRNGL
jgi:hypothetical protein